MAEAASAPIKDSGAHSSSGSNQAPKCFTVLLRKRDISMFISRPRRILFQKIAGSNNLIVFGIDAARTGTSKEMARQILLPGHYLRQCLTAYFMPEEQQSSLTAGGTTLFNQHLAAGPCTPGLTHVQDLHWTSLVQAVWHACASGRSRLV